MVIAECEVESRRAVVKRAVLCSSKAVPVVNGGDDTGIVNSGTSVEGLCSLVCANKSSVVSVPEGCVFKSSAVVSPLCPSIAAAQIESKTANSLA